MMTSIAHEVDARLKNALGKMAYYLKGLGEIPKFRAVPLTITADGVKHELEAFLFVVINSGVVGSMKNVASGLAVDDGKLDLLAIKKCGVHKLMAITAELVAGHPVNEKDCVLHLQAKDFRIETEGELPSDLDGEEGPMLPLTILWRGWGSDISTSCWCISRERGMRKSTRQQSWQTRTGLSASCRTVIRRCSPETAAI